LTDNAYLLYVTSGWAYDVLTDVDSALDRARDIQVSFLTEKQGSIFHHSPKTLSVVNTVKFLTFLGALEL
jgi:hypothetical protein